MEINVTLPENIHELNVVYPSGKNQKIEAWHRKAVFTGSEIGLYRLTAGDKSWTIAVNMNSEAESNLLDRSSGNEMLNLMKGDSSKYFSDVRWWFIVPLLCLLLLHQWIISRRRPDYVY